MNFPRSENLRDKGRGRQCQAVFKAQETDFIKMESTLQVKAIFFAIDKIRKQKHQRPHRDNIVKLAVEE